MFSTQIHTTYCTFKDAHMSKGLGLCGTLATGNQEVTIWHMHRKKVQQNNDTFSVYHFLSMSITNLWLRFPAASSCAESIYSLE